MSTLQLVLAAEASDPLGERIFVAAVGPLITVLVGGLVVWAVTSRVQRRRAASDRSLQEKREDDIRESDRLRADLLREQDQRRDRDKMSFEAGLAREQKVIDAQAQFLADLSRTLFATLQLIKEVSYYHDQNEGYFHQSRKKYHERAGESFTEVRAVMGRALWLAPSSYDDLINFYFNILVPADKKLLSLENAKMAGDDQPDSWSAFNDYLVFDFSQEIETLISRLAEAMELKASSR
jgi:hypothetical protein